MFDVRSSTYYNTLPDHIKKQILNSGLNFKTESELREYVKIFIDNTSWSASVQL